VLPYVERVSVADRLDEFRLPPHHRRSRTESERIMLGHIADELGLVRHSSHESMETRVRRSLPIARDTDDITRPQTRNDCVSCPECQRWRDTGAGGFPGALACGHAFAEAVAHSRPCVFVGCSTGGLYVDESETTNNLTFHDPDVEPQDRTGETCALDIADRGGVTLEEVGAAYSVTRERVRQIEDHGIRIMQRQTARELGIPPERHDGMAVHLAGPMRGRGHGPG
jgi:hypothetical protein